MTGSRPRFPADGWGTIEVRPAYGRFDDLATVVGTQRPDAGDFAAVADLDRIVAAEVTGELIARVAGKRLATVVGRRVPIVGGVVGAGVVGWGPFKGGRYAARGLLPRAARQ